MDKDSRRPSTSARGQLQLKTQGKKGVNPPNTRDMTSGQDKKSPGQGAPAAVSFLNSNFVHIISQMSSLIIATTTGVPAFSSIILIYVAQVFVLINYVCIFRRFQANGQRQQHSPGLLTRSFPVRRISLRKRTGEESPRGLAPQTQLRLQLAADKTNQGPPT